MQTEIPLIDPETPLIDSEMWSKNVFENDKDFNSLCVNSPKYTVISSNDDENYNASYQEKQENTIHDNYSNFHEDMTKSCAFGEEKILLDQSSQLLDYERPINQNDITILKNTYTQFSDINKNPKDKTTEIGLSPDPFSSPSDPFMNLPNTPQDTTVIKIKPQEYAVDNGSTKPTISQITSLGSQNQFQMTYSQKTSEVSQTQSDTQQSETTIPGFEQLIAQTNELTQTISHNTEPESIIQQWQLSSSVPLPKARKVFNIVRNERKIYLKELAEGLKKKDDSWSIDFSIENPKSPNNSENTFLNSYPNPNPNPKKNIYRNFSGGVLSYLKQDKSVPLIRHIYLEILKECHLPKVSCDQYIDDMVIKFGQWIREIHKNELSSQIKLRNILNIKEQKMKVVIFRRTLHFVMLFFIDKKYDDWIDNSIQFDEPSSIAQRKYKHEIREFINKRFQQILYENQAKDYRIVREYNLDVYSDQLVQITINQDYQTFLVTLLILLS